MIKCAPRDGIASAIPIQCQYSAGQLFPLFGGGTSKKLQRRASLYRSLENFIVASFWGTDICLIARISNLTGRDWRAAHGPPRQLAHVYRLEPWTTRRVTGSQDEFRRRSEPNDARSRPVARRRAAARVVTARTRDS